MTAHPVIWQGDHERPRRGGGNVGGPGRGRLGNRQVAQHMRACTSIMEDSKKLMLAARSLVSYQIASTGTVAGPEESRLLNLIMTGSSAHGNKSQRTHVRSNATQTQRHLASLIRPL